MLVADRPTWFKINNLIPKPSQMTYETIFKRCHIKAAPPYKGYGFRLFRATKVKPKHMVFSLDPNSPAYAANLRETDVIIEVEGVNVRRLKTSAVNKLMDATLKKGNMEILAIEISGYESFTSN